VELLEQVLALVVMAELPQLLELLAAQEHQIILAVVVVALVMALVQLQAVLVVFMAAAAAAAHLPQSQLAVLVRLVSSSLLTRPFQVICF